MSSKEAVVFANFSKILGLPWDSDRIKRETTTFSKIQREKSLTFDTFALFETSIALSAFAKDTGPGMLT